MDGKFNTQGGYFTPFGYMKVNEGGSHEENPNGGVQVGVDNNGAPNLLEEGEPVYKDFVYSDNIRIQDSLIEKHKLPNKIKGKLYSEAADMFVDEAEEMPLDSVANKGLNSMLLRLARAQEEQKQIDEEQALEDELANMSPDELAELEQMLALQDAATQEASPVTPQAEVPIEQQAAVPIMAHGGLMNTFGEGGPEEDGDLPPARNLIFNQELGYAYPADPLVAKGPQLQPSVVTATHPFTQGVTNAINDFGNKVIEVGSDIAEMTPTPIGVGVNIAKGINDVKNHDYLSAGLRGLAVFGGAARGINSLTDGLTSEGAKLVEEASTKISKYKKELDDARKAARAAKKAHNGQYEALKKSADDLAGRIKFEESEISRFRKQYKAPKQSSSATESTAGNSQENTGKTFLQKVGTAVKNTFNPAGVMLQKWQPEGTAGKVAKVASQIGLDGLWYTGAGIGVNAAIDAAQNYKDLHGSYGVNNNFAKGGYVNKFNWGGDEPDGVWYRPVFSPAVTLKPSAVTSRRPVTEVIYPYTEGTVVRNVEHPETEQQPAQREIVYPYVEDAGVRSGDTSSLWFNPTYQPAAQQPAGAGVLYPYVEREEGAYPLMSDEQYNSILWYHPSWNASEPASVAPVEQQPAAQPIVEPVKESTNKASSVKSAKKNSSAPAQAAAAQQVIDAVRRPITAIKSGDTILSKAPAEDGLHGKRPENISYAGHEIPPELLEDDSNSNPNFDWMQFAGPLYNLGVATANALQSPDRYNIRRYNPQLSTGRMDVRHQVFNPLDNNMLVQQTLASGAGTVRALRNSGMGPSTGAAILAADKNIGQNLGTGFLQTWDANNQRQNQVIGANNAVDQALGQFNFGVSNARASVANAAQQYNIGNELLQQRLNNQAEQDKWNAVSAASSGAMKGLSDIDLQRRRKELASAGSLYGYGYNGNEIEFKPKALGGILLKPYKK